MSILKYFKNTPGRPPHRATGPKCNFFLQICNEIPGQKKMQGGPVAPQRATGGAVAPPSGDRDKPSYIRSNPPLSSSFEPENSTKNPEKKERSEEKESGEALPDSALVICRLVHLV